MSIVIMLNYVILLKRQGFNPRVRVIPIRPYLTIAPPPMPVLWLPYPSQDDNYEVGQAINGGLILWTYPEYRGVVAYNEHAALLANTYGFDRLSFGDNHLGDKITWYVIDTTYAVTKGNVLVNDTDERVVIVPIGRESIADFDNGE